MAYFKHVSDGNKGKIIYNRSIVNGIVLLAISEIEGVEAATVESLKNAAIKRMQKVREGEIYGERHLRGCFREDQSKRLRFRYGV